MKFSSLRETLWKASAVGVKRSRRGVAPRLRVES
jgi:hypothetical protein